MERKKTNAFKMNQTINCALFVPALLLLLGFSWGDLSWEKINQDITRNYPTVRHIDTDTLKADLEQGKQLVLIDVREENEFSVSHLPTAINIINTDDVSFSKDTFIIAYCSVGIRSAKFAEKLGKRGFTKVFNLRGSIFEWGNKGYPLMRGREKVKSVHPYNDRWGILLKKQLHLYKPPE